jgi:hypothetical protein
MSEGKWANGNYANFSFLHFHANERREKGLKNVLHLVMCIKSCSKDGTKNYAQKKISLKN